MDEIGRKCTLGYLWIVIDRNRNFQLRPKPSIADTEYSVSAEYSVPIAEYHRIAAFYTNFFGGVHHFMGFKRFSTTFESVSVN
jgi:hypothetical protein